MAFSWTIAAEIYQARSHRWRKIHTVLNSITLLLFLCQRVTGYRTFLAIRLSGKKTNLSLGFQKIKLVRNQRQNTVKYFILGSFLLFYTE